LIGVTDGSSTDRDLALRLLAGLEEGGMPASEAAIAAEDLDPVLVYFIVQFLRAVYPASSPAAHAVLQRVVELTSAYPAIVRKSKVGEEDPVSRWFGSEYAFGDFRGRGAELIEMIVDKLES
jgi:hypothetical protein